MYYYWLKKVREAYLAENTTCDTTTDIVPIPIADTNAAIIPSQDVAAEKPIGIEISKNGFSLQVTSDTSMELLGNVLKVVDNVK